MIDPGLLSEAKALMITLAPELANRPLYVIDDQLLAGTPYAASDCLGWCINRVVMHRPIIDRLGDAYQGPGVVIAFDEAKMREFCKPEQFHALLMQTAVHEAAHCFPIPSMVVEPGDTAAVREFQMARMAESLASPDPPAGDEYDPHDWRFIRRTCHLWFRSKLLGLSIPTTGIVKGHIFTSLFEYYLCELLAECVSMKDATIAAIEALPPPPEFMRIWQGDVDYINAKRKEGKTLWL